MQRSTGLAAAADSGIAHRYEMNVFLCLRRIGGRAASAARFARDEGRLATRLSGRCKAGKVNVKESVSTAQLDPTDSSSSPRE